MPTVAEKAALHPLQLREARAFALLAIIHGYETEWFPASLREHVADETAALRAEQVSPERAASLLRLHDAGQYLRVVSGGGETTDLPRPALRLLAGAR